jgi:hypothetical protein
MLHTKKDAPHIDGHDAVENLGSVCNANASFSTDPGIVECEIEPPEMFDRAGDQCRDLVLASHVCSHKQAAAASLLHECNRLCSLGFATTGNDDVCAMLGKSDRCRPPDSGGSAGDQDDFSCK